MKETKDYSWSKDRRIPYHKERKYVESQEKIIKKKNNYDKIPYPLIERKNKSKIT